MLPSGPWRMMRHPLCPLIPIVPATSFSKNSFGHPLRASLGLDPEPWKNFTRVVALHLVLDRLLTLTITRQLCSGREAERDQIVESISSVVSEMPFARRTDVAAKAGWLPSDIVDDLREVNRVRNRLLHFSPHRKRFDETPEITPTGFKAFALRGHHAYYGLITAILPLFAEAADNPEVNPESGWCRVIG